MSDTVYIAGKQFEELLSLFLCDIKNDDDYFDVVAYNLAKSYRPQLEVMLQVLSAERLRAAICGFGLVGVCDDKLEIIISQYLDHENEFVVSASVDTLGWLERGDWGRISLLSQHKSPYVRGAVLRYCKSKFGSNAAKILFDALEDKDPIVRENALDELDGIADESMIPTIKHMLNDSSTSVQKAAEALLRSIETA